MEVILAILVYAILLICFGSGRIIAWGVDKRSGISTITSLAAGISGVTFAAYFAVLATDFGKRLRLAGASVEYAIAFAFPVILFLATTGVWLVISRDSEPYLVEAAVLLLIYSGINCATMVKNVIGLVGLWQGVEKARVTGKS